MPKTCRTCKLRDYYCDEPAGTLVHVRRLGAGGGDCPYWSEAKTPLLVDALAKMVVGMIDAMTGSWYVYRTIPGTQEVDKEIVRKAGALIAQAHVLVYRYKKEVGDA